MCTISRPSQCFQPAVQPMWSPSPGSLRSLSYYHSPNNLPFVKSPAFEHVFPWPGMLCPLNLWSICQFTDRAHHPLFLVPIGLCKCSEYKIQELCHTNFKVYLFISPCTRLTPWSVGTVIAPLSPHVKAHVCFLYCNKFTVQKKPCSAQSKL